jgi:CRISPR-associated endonuclease Csy4
MMSHYLDILLRPDPEIPPHQLMAALYSKLHLALVQLNSSTIGVSFPDYAESPACLGTRLRLCAKEVDLQRLMALPWLGALQDHIHSSALAMVPSSVGYRYFSRVQAKSNPERLRRRQIKRHGLTAEEALARVPDSCAETLKLPYVVLRSTSTAHTFRLFLRCELASIATDGLFNTYGLSTTATIPWF